MWASTIVTCCACIVGALNSVLSDVSDQHDGSSEESAWQLETHLLCWHNCEDDGSLKVLVIMPAS